MDDERELLRGNTPTLVLAVLRDGPVHGYALAKEITRRSGEALRCKQGTLYPALHALEQEGLILGEWEHDAGERPRKVYRITTDGLTELQRRTETWRSFCDAVERVLHGSPSRETDGHVHSV